MKFTGIIVTIFSIVFLLACKRIPVQTEDPVITLEKTPCFGTCEAYKMQVFANGLVKFNGSSNHPMIGNYVSHIEKDSLAILISVFRDAQFFNFKDEYTSNDSDLPTVYVSFRDQGKKKTVKDYYKAPSQLKDLEKKVEQLVTSLKWKKVD